MRQRKTDPHTQRHHKTSSPHQPGLIVTELQNPQSARTKSALDNRFHRTALYRPLRMLKARPLLLPWSRPKPKDRNKEGLS